MESSDERQAELVALMGPPPWRMWVEQNGVPTEVSGVTGARVIQVGDGITVVDTGSVVGFFEYPWKVTEKRYDPPAILGIEQPDGRRLVISTVVRP